MSCPYSMVTILSNHKIYILKLHNIITIDLILIQRFQIYFHYGTRHESTLKIFFYPQHMGLRLEKSRVQTIMKVIYFINIILFTNISLMSFVKLFL
jgi:hypothetical protein